MVSTIDSSALQQQISSLQGQLSAAQPITLLLKNNNQNIDGAPTVSSATNFESALPNAEAGNITEKEYNRILERSLARLKLTVTNHTCGWRRWSMGASVAAIEAQI